MNFSDYENAHAKIKEKISADFGDTFCLIVHFFDSMQFLIYKYIIRYLKGIGNNEHKDIILSTLIKGLNNLQSAISLTENGEIGSARIIIRNVFEFLVLGKYSLLTGDRKVIDKWDKIEYVNIDRLVIRNIIFPNDKSKGSFIEFWRILCSYTHATRASGQDSYDYLEIRNGVNLNFSFIQILLIMTYHFMEKFLATAYFKQYLYSITRSEELMKHQNYTATTSKHIRKSLTEECQQVIKFYLATWRLIRPQNVEKSFEEENLPTIVPKKKFENEFILYDKSDVLKYLGDFIIFYEGERDSGNDYLPALPEYIKKMKSAVKKEDLPKIEDHIYEFYYDLEINAKYLTLSLYKQKYQDIEKEVIESQFVYEIVRINCKYRSIEEYAALQNVTVNTVKRWIHSYKIHEYLVIREHYYISDLQQRPTRNFYYVSYCWDYLPKDAQVKYPYLIGSSRIDISFVKKNYKIVCALHEESYNEEERIELEKILTKFATAEELQIICVP